MKSGKQKIRYRSVAKGDFTLLRQRFLAGDWETIANLHESDIPDEKADVVWAMIASAQLCLGLMDECPFSIQKALSAGVSREHLYDLMQSTLHQIMAYLLLSTKDQGAENEVKKALERICSSEEQQYAKSSRIMSAQVQLEFMEDAVATVQSSLSTVPEAAQSVDIKMQMLDIQAEILIRNIRRATKNNNPADVVDFETKNRGKLLPGYMQQDLPRTKYFGLNNIDKIVEEEYLCFDNGYFVELGANDGVEQSNTLYFELNRGWKGVLVEPILHNYLKCLANRSPQTQSFCYACVDDSYQEKAVILDYANLMSVSHNLDTDLTDIKDHLDKAKSYIPQYQKVTQTAAVARTLTSILDDANAPKKIDFLSLDVEGAELTVLKGLDFTQYQFRVICVECRKFEEVSAYLKQYGYRCRKAVSAHDYIFTREIA